MAHRFPTHFTVEQADRWVPRLRELFAQIHAILDSVADQVNAIHSQAVRRGGNGGGVDARRYFSPDKALEDALARIQDAGIVIQDVRRGLVDFPHLMGGQEVFLCRELSDGERVDWYHDLQAGYAGRTRLSRSR
jgi:hypothetical protein